jgi:hypothetical protein
MKLQELAIAHLALCAAVLLWNLWAAGRAAQLRYAPRFLAAISGLGGLLVLPALAVHLLSGSLLTGRAFASIAWIWPLTVALVATQAIYATTRGMLSPAIGIPIAVYDLLLALIYAAAYLADAGYLITDPLTVLVAAERGAIALSTLPAALSLPWYLHVPIIAPCTALRRGISGVLHIAVAAVALVWGGTIIAALPGASRAVQSYERFAAERLRERPEQDFTIGIKIFPTVGAVVPSSSVQRDLALADSIGTQALCIYISPRGTSASTLRSLAETLDGVRGERQIVVALDLAHAIPRGIEASGLPADRVADVDALVSDAARIARILRPDYLVPVVAPMTVGIESAALTPTLPSSPDRSHSAPGAGTDRGDSRGKGSSGDTDRALALWQRYITAAAQAVHDANRETRVMAHIGGLTTRDSALYAWAASYSSPVDAVALTLFPGPSGATDISRAERTIDRGLTARSDAPAKEHWILEAGGFPTVHGELSQSRALWGILAWSTNHPVVRGVIAFEASDYSTRLGLQAPSGRIRLAAGTLKRAIAGLGE